MVDLVYVDVSRRGYGESKPVASNDPDAARQENRLVEIVAQPLSGPGPPSMLRSTVRR